MVCKLRANRISRSRSLRADPALPRKRTYAISTCAAQHLPAGSQVRRSCRGLEIHPWRDARWLSDSIFLSHEDWCRAALVCQCYRHCGSILRVLSLHEDWAQILLVSTLNQSTTRRISSTANTAWRSRAPTLKDLASEGGKRTVGRK